MHSDRYLEAPPYTIEGHVQKDEMYLILDFMKELLPGIPSQQGTTGIDPLVTSQVSSVLLETISGVLKSLQGL